MPTNYAQQAQDILTEQLWNQYEEERKVFLEEMHRPVDSLGRRYTRGRLPEHGTITRYKNYKCRCEECRACGLEYYREYRRRRGIPERTKVTHGTIAMYKRHKCRCTPCRNQARIYYEQLRREKGIPVRHSNSFKRHYYEEQCRCAPCVKWQEKEVQRVREYRARKRKQENV